MSPASRPVSPRLQATNYSSVYRARSSAGGTHRSKVSHSNARLTMHQHVRTLVFFEPKGPAVLHSNQFRRLQVGLSSMAAYRLLHRASRLSRCAVSAPAFQVSHLGTQARHNCLAVRATASYDTIRSETEGSAGVITISKPKALNALSSQVSKLLLVCYLKLKSSRA